MPPVALVAILTCLLSAISMSSCRTAPTPAAPEPIPAPPALAPEPVSSGIVLGDDGAVELGKGPEGRYFSIGVFASPEIPRIAFDRAVLSWQVSTPPGTWIIVEAQAKVGTEWSRLYGLGSWGRSTRSGSSGSKQKDRFGTVDIDTIALIRPASALRYVVTFRSEDPGSSPLLRKMELATYLAEGQAPLSAALPPSELWARELDVPLRSQMVEDPSIASRICSPTSLSMLLAYYGRGRPTAEVAAGVHDYGAGIYGNWSFNMAYASELGLPARVAWFASLDDLKREIGAGRPVVASIAFQENQLDGAPINATTGHLVVVRGFKVVEGREYVIVNDPAAPDETSVRREYKAEQFDKAWKRIVYLVGE
jgi:uncharacterized protein YvpB